VIRISTQDLRSKFGFHDGDILSDFLFDFPKLWDLEHDVIFALCKKHIEPRLPDGVEMYRIHTHHNPVRLKDMDAIFDDFEIEVTAEEVLETAKAIYTTHHDNREE
jgi:hypothetical protein